MMLMMDPPQHTRYRLLVSKEFTPRSVQALRPRIEELARKIIDRVITRGECDLVGDIAGELPSYVIADLMGIPLEDGRRLYELTERMHASEEAVPAHDRADRLDGDAELRDGGGGRQAPASGHPTSPPSC